MNLATLIGMIVGIIAVVFAIVTALYATGLIKRGFQRTEGKTGVKPVTKKKLEQMFVKLNKNKTFSVKKAKDTDLFVEWKVVDARWIEVLGPAWMKKNYCAWVMLDDKKKTVRYCEQITEKSFTAGAAGAHGEMNYFRGIQLWRKERGYRFGIKKDFTVGEIYNYKFNPAQVKDVLRQIANDNGWAFELVVSKGQASYLKNKR